MTVYSIVIDDIAWSSHKEGGIKVAPMYWWHAYWYRWQHSALSFHPTVQKIVRETQFKRHHG
jgi:hypothetical protein